MENFIMAVRTNKRPAIFLYDGKLWRPESLKGGAFSKSSARTLDFYGKTADYIVIY